MKSVLAKLLATAALMACGAASAETMLRVRAIEIMPHANSAPVSGVDVKNKHAPDLDASWFFRSNLALELLLTIPQSHQATLNGTDLGKAQHLPPTLLLQYYHPIHSGARAYVGGGVNYTFFTDRDLNGGLRLEAGSFGPAVQMGVDFPLRGNWYANLDLKKIWIDSDVSNANGFVTHVNINPVVAGIGLGYRFN